MYNTIASVVMCIYAFWAIIHQTHNLYNYLKWYVSGNEKWPYPTYYNNIIEHFYVTKHQELPLCLFGYFIHSIVAAVSGLVWPITVIAVPTYLITTYFRNKNIERAKIIKALKS